jgi:organic hydroperoxide reductase OsmC/OhrA
VEQRARVFTYGVTIDGDWTVQSDAGGAPLPREEAWTPEHLLLAALARCSLTALEFHAKRGGIELRSSGAATGSVTRREEDGRFAFVEIEVELDVTLEPQPEAVRELLAKAERDCFVGASLALEPTYRWTVNGQGIA